MRKEGAEENKKERENGVLYIHIYVRGKPARGYRGSRQLHWESREDTGE